MLGKAHWWVIVLIPPPLHGETKAQKAGETGGYSVKPAHNPQLDSPKPNSIPEARSESQEA